MSARMKKRLTKDDITILVRGIEVDLRSSVKSSLANIINELIDFDTCSAEEVHGEWVKDPRMRVAKYLKGARKREGLTQKEVCKKLSIQQSNLSKMESGERPIPKKLIRTFSKLYNIKEKMLNENSFKKAG